MNFIETDARVLADRVRRLEKENLMWKVGGLLVVLVSALSLAVGVRAQQSRAQATPPAAQRIVAQDFQLRDATGILRGELSVANGQPKLDLYDAAGKVVWSTNPRMVAGGN